MGLQLLLSMTATTITEYPTPTAPVPDNSTTGSFMLDSGSSLSVTNCINDIINPIELGVDGVVIHASHVGSAC